MKKDKILIFSISYILPLILCFLLKFWFNCIDYDVCKLNGIKSARILLGIWEVVFGFIIITTLILLIIDGNKYIHILKKSKHYSTILLTYCFESSILLIAAVFSIIVIYLNIWNEFLFYFLIYLIISSILLLFFCIFFLFFMIYNSIRLLTTDNMTT